MDVEFIGNTAYVLVTLVGTDVGGNDVVGIYRVDDSDSFTVVADIGAFAGGQSTEHSIRSSDRCPVCARYLPRWVLGHRWAPQPGAVGHTRRRGPELIAFGICADRAGGAG